MAPVVNDIPAPAKHADFALLNDHLPQTITLLRRLQFTHFPQDTTEHAHYLFASDPDGPPEYQGGQGGHFAAAHLDLSKGPETELYFYSTLEDYYKEPQDGRPSDGELEHILDIIIALLQRVRAIARSTLSSGAHPLFREHGLMVGGLHEPTYQLLRERRGLTSSYWNPHDAWLFRLDRLPALPEGGLEGLFGEHGLRWDVVRRGDCRLIASRTRLPKVEATLMSEPSVAVRDARGVLVAWGFMGVAGTLSTLHVEEPYRGRGVAKALAAKVFRDHSFGDDGWGELPCFWSYSTSQWGRPFES